MCEDAGKYLIYLTVFSVYDVVATLYTRPSVMNPAVPLFLDGSATATFLQERFEISRKRCTKHVV